MMRMIKSAARAALPVTLLRELSDEIRISLGRARHARATKRKVLGLRNCRVNVGCGGSPTPGWVNLDVFSSDQVSFWDCRRGLPLAGDAAVAIYMEHAFEHLEVESQAKLFLRECLRCLRAGGVLRIVVPDAGAYLRAYGGSWTDMQTLRSLERRGDGWYDPWLRCVYRTQMEVVNAVFRQGHEHKYAYDEETLVCLLKSAGFSRVVRQSFNVSLDPEMTKDSESRKSESLYVEAVK